MFFFRWSDDSFLNIIPFSDKMSSSEPYGCSLLLALYRFSQFFLQKASREFPYEELAWSYHFYSQTKYDFYDVLCTYFFSSFLCVCIKGHSVDDWVILAVLLRSGVLFFFLSWGAHFFKNWLQNGVHGKLVWCIDSIVWWGCSTLELKQSCSRSEGAPCFELK